MTKRRWLLALVVCVFIVEMVDPYRGSWLIRKAFLTSYAAEITVELEVDGKPFTMSRKVGCIPELTHPEFKFGTKYHRSINAFGERLPWGGAVMMVVPAPCLYWREELPNGYIPLLGYVPDPNSFDSYEAYLHPVAFEAENTHVHFVSIKSEPIPDWFWLDGGDEFEFFGYDFRNKPVPHSITKAFSYSLKKAPFEYWSTSSEAEAYLGQLSESVKLPRDVLYANWSSRMFPSYFSASLLQGRGLPGGRRLMTQLGEDGPPFIIASEAIPTPLRIIENSLTQSPDEVGIAFVYRPDRLPSENNSVAIADGDLLVAEGILSNVPGRYFKLENRTLYALGKSYWPIPRDVRESGE